MVKCQAWRQGNPESFGLQSLFLHSVLGEYTPALTFPVSPPAQPNIQASQGLKFPRRLNPSWDTHIKVVTYMKTV